ncbi:hypothetical protein NFI96_027207, partial [Prochilodus magdalenae]
SLWFRHSVGLLALNRLTHDTALNSYYSVPPSAMAPLLHSSVLLLFIAHLGFGRTEEHIRGFDVTKTKAQDDTAILLDSLVRHHCQSLVTVAWWTVGVTGQRTWPSGHGPQDAAHWMLPTERRPLDAAHWTLPKGHCPLDAAHRRLPKGRCPQDAAHWMLPTGHCLLDTAHWTLPTGHCLKDAVGWIVLLGGRFSVQQLHHKVSSSTAVSDPLTPTQHTLTHHHKDSTRNHIHIQCRRLDTHIPQVSAVFFSFSGIWELESLASPWLMCCGLMSDSASDFRLMVEFVCSADTMKPWTAMVNKAVCRLVVVPYWWCSHGVCLNTALTSAGYVSLIGDLCSPSCTSWTPAVSGYNWRSILEKSDEGTGNMCCGLRSDSASDFRLMVEFVCSTDTLKPWTAMVNKAVCRLVVVPYWWCSHGMCLNTALTSAGYVSLIGDPCGLSCTSWTPAVSGYSMPISLKIPSSSRPSRSLPSETTKLWLHYDSQRLLIRGLKPQAHSFLPSICLPSTGRFTGTGEVTMPCTLDRISSLIDSDDRKSVITLASFPLSADGGRPHLRIFHQSCALKMDEGPCKALKDRFYFDIDTGRCEPFEYGGCQGNANNFETLEACEEMCLVKANKSPCHLEDEPGPCRGLVPRYFFDSKKQECRRFFYGGCFGNANNFKTLKECRDRCQPGNDTQEPGHGPKPEAEARPSGAPAIIHEKLTETVIISQPHTQTLPERNAEFTPPDVCMSRVSRGHCEGSERRYAYNPRTKRCTVFLYTGCGGSKNNFVHKRHCIKTCMPGNVSIVSISAVH